jgi:hypothetical protein
MLMAMAFVFLMHSFLILDVFEDEDWWMAAMTQRGVAIDF